MRFVPLYRIFFLLSILVGAASLPGATDTYQVVHAYPHDEQAFTQGLVFVDGYLYESTGLKGHSSLRMEDLENGRILKFQDVPSRYFAEGLTNWGGTLIQLTWQSHTALVYDRSTLRFFAHLSVRRRRLGIDSGRQEPDPERRQRNSALLRS